MMENEMVRRFTALPRGGVDPALLLAISAGSIEDYDALAAFHYLRSRPAMVMAVLAAREVCRQTSGGNQRETPRCAALDSPPVAVLVVSMPTLNGPWRRAAWPGVFEGDKRQAARRTNALLRTISRVVVDPRWRGLGVARRLVRTYLDAPMTPLTEAVSAMGPVCSCFAAAGMREAMVVRPRHDARLLAALEGAGIEPWQLLDPERRARVDERAIRVWARASRAHRSLAGGEIGVLALRAARALVAGRAVYIAGGMDRRSLPVAPGG
jgi:predicted GNAT family acetyltransferase